MCEQCLADTVPYDVNKETGNIEEFLHNIVLVRATSDTGIVMRKDDWGFVTNNDPDLVFTETPDVEFDYVDDDCWERLDKFRSRFRWDATLGFDYVVAAMDKGYDPRDESFDIWFYNYTFKWIETHKLRNEKRRLP